MLVTEIELMVLPHENMLDSGNCVFILWRLVNILTFWKALLTLAGSREMHGGSAGTGTARPGELPAAAPRVAVWAGFKTPACFKISDPEKESTFWNLKHPACSCSSFDVFRIIGKPQVWGGATGPARQDTRTRHIQPGEGMQVPSSVAASAVPWIPAGAGNGAGGWGWGWSCCCGAEELRPAGPRSGGCSTASAAMLCGRSGSATGWRWPQGEKCLLVFYYSSKSAENLVLFSRSGILRWEGRLENLAWWGRDLGCVSGQGSLKIWSRCG